MTRQTRRRFSPEYKEQAVARLLAPGATQASVAAELGVTPTQLKTWRLELEAAGSASAIERQQAEAGELVRLRQDNKRLKEEVEVLRKASAFFAQWAAKTCTKLVFMAQHGDVPYVCGAGFSACAQLVSCYLKRRAAPP